MRNRKLLLGLLILLTLCFASSLGIGALDGVKGLVPVLMGTLQEVASGANQRVGLEDLESANPPACDRLLGEGALTLQEGIATCQLEIDASSSPRSLSLRLHQGARAEIELILRMEENWQSDISLDARRCQDVQFPEGGGRIELRCLDQGSATGCEFTLVQRGC